MSSIQPTLWDQCILYILSTIDTYPITHLAMLPLRIRKKIFMALSILDRLHFINTEFMSGLEMAEHSEYTTDSNSMVTLSTKEPSNDIKQHVVQAVFAEPQHLDDYSVLDCDNFIFLFQCIYSCPCSNPTQGLSLLLDWIALVEFNNIAMRAHRFPSRLELIPSRHFKYFDLGSEYVSTPPVAAAGQSFITYCNLNTFDPTYLGCLTITEKFLYSPFWNEYKFTLFKAIEQAKIKGVRDLTTIDPLLAQPIYPHLQELLSHVEELHFCIDWAFHGKYEANVIVPYLVMCNAIANRSTARLKSINIFVANRLYNMALYRKALYTIAGFLVGCDFFALSYCYNVEISDDVWNQYRYSLCPPEGEPYYIENIAIDFYYWNAIDFDVLEGILKKQMSSLTSVTIIFPFVRSALHPLSAQVYKQLLTGTLVQFVKQPQFRSLTLYGRIPEGRCYDLVKAFLASPTSHDQQLTIEVKEDEQVDDFLPSDYCQLNKLDCHPSCPSFKSIEIVSCYKSKLAEEIKQLPLHH